MSTLRINYDMKIYYIYKNHIYSSLSCYYFSSNRLHYFYLFVYLSFLNCVIKLCYIIFNSLLLKIFVICKNLILNYFFTTEESLINIKNIFINKIYLANIIISLLCK